MSAVPAISFPLHHDYRERFLRLGRLLDDYRWLWRPQPFKEARPQWSLRLPQLTERLLALSDGEVERLNGDPAALIDLVAAELPPLAELHALIALEEGCGERSGDSEATPLSARELDHIPGRKLEQIRAFAATLTSARLPLVEWCGGKGHLGRLLSAVWHQPVTTLEWNGQLCLAGEALAQRSGSRQQFLLRDLLSEPSHGELQGRHGVGLHACGELHRTLLRQGVAAVSRALDIAPCCYSHGVDSGYAAFNTDAPLELTRDDLRLAVTETVTARGREVKRRDREMAWKLGFDRLRRDRTHDDRYRPIKPIDKRWLNEGFEGFCRRLGAREGLSLASAAIDWAHYEAHGWRRQGEVMRLSLVRHAFRRPLELYLVLDMAAYLERYGYRVSLATFCARSVTPRNILISARRD